MHLDVIDLRAFYYRSRLGRAVQYVLRRDLARLWPDVKGMSVAGYGFAAPLLRPYLRDARRVSCFMPGPQGVMPWPAQMPNRSALVEEAAWPVQTGGLDRLVVLHGLETCDDPAALLEEIYRVLGPGGRVVFILPNRTGMWSRSDATPFGYGRPYTLGQAEAQLRQFGFEITEAFSTLYQPPSNSKFWRKIARSVERFGRHVPGFAAGGVLVIEAVKRVPAPTRPGLGQRVSIPERLIPGFAHPEPAGRTKS